MNILPRNHKRRRRLLRILALSTLLAIAVGLILTSFKKNMMYFYTPSEILSMPTPPKGVVELGGLVVAGSVRFDPENARVSFIVSDGDRQLPVIYPGILPDLFREGQGVIAYGQWREGVIYANRVLAKHDENYTPPRVLESLRREPPTTATEQSER